ncbi:MAG TPA: EamA family transporter [Spirochaetia bacterium]|nr:EamA family transporter [Spirochaetia bacterium]
MRPKTILAAAVTISLWASAFVAIRAGLEGYSPGHLALLRYAIASLVFAGYAAYRRFGLPAMKDVPGILLTGLLGIAVYNIALNFGEVQVPAGPASFIVSSTPVFTVLLSTVILKERLNILAWVGIMVSFSGVAMITLYKQGDFKLGWGALLVLVCAVTQAFFFTLQKKYLVRYSSDRLTAYIIWSGTIFLSIFTPGLFQQVWRADPGSTLSAVYLGLFPAAIAYAAWSYVLSKLKASVAASFLYLVPIVTTVIAWIWIRETPSLFMAIGGVITMVGVFLVNNRSRLFTGGASAPINTQQAKSGH